MLRCVAFSCASYTISSYVKIPLSWCYVTRISWDFMLRYDVFSFTCYVTRTSFDFMPPCAAVIRPTCFHMSMRGCGAEGADKLWKGLADFCHKYGKNKVWSGPVSSKKCTNSWEGCRKLHLQATIPKVLTWHLSQHRFNMNVLKTNIFHHSQHRHEFEMTTKARHLIGAGTLFNPLFATAERIN